MSSVPATPTARRTAAPQAERLLALDPALGAGVPAAELTEASARVYVPLLTLEPGELDLRRLADGDPLGPFALLVADGLVTRDVSLLGRTATQLVGPGDVLALRGADGGPAMVWGCATRVRLAVLDKRLLAATRQWPWLAARLIERAASWADRSLDQQAINQVGRVELRLLFMLVHVAERWGRVTPEGVYVPLRLTHDALGRLVGAQRPTVSLAVKELREQGVLARRGEGWLIAPGASEDLPFDSVLDGSHRTIGIARDREDAAPVEGLVSGTLGEHLDRMRAAGEGARRRDGASVAAVGLEDEDLEGARGFEDDLAVIAEHLPADDLLHRADRLV